MKAVIQKILEKAGMKIVRYPEPDLKRRIHLFHHFGINKLFDVGANQGQYALLMRKLGYTGNIISFEPLKDAFDKLSRAAAADPKWQVEHMALGHEDTVSEINIANNSYSSSLLDMLPAHLESAPQSAYVGKQPIQVHRLDTVFSKYYQDQDHIFLKIDTQGFEKNVIDGAAASLPRIRGIQMEMSLIELYRGEMLFTDMLAYLKDRGFDLYSLETGFSDEHTGQLLQVDGVFFNRNIQKQAK